MGKRHRVLHVCVRCLLTHNITAPTTAHDVSSPDTAVAAQIGNAAPCAPVLLPCTRSIDARLEWAAKEMFGGKLSFALLMGDLISAAAPTLSSNAPGPDRHSFAAAAGRILAQALDKARDIMAAVMAHYGRCEALTALAAAQQQLSLLGAVDRD